MRVHVNGSGKASPEEPEELLRFSSLNLLLRVTAWCLQWSRDGRGMTVATIGSRGGDNLEAARMR